MQLNPVSQPTWESQPTDQSAGAHRIPLVLLRGRFSSEAPRFLIIVKKSPIRSSANIADSLDYLLNLVSLVLFKHSYHNSVLHQFIFTDTVKTLFTTTAPSIKMIICLMRLWPNKTQRNQLLNHHKHFSAFKYARYLSFHTGYNLFTSSILYRKHLNFTST